MIILSPDNPRIAGHYSSPGASIPMEPLCHASVDPATSVFNYQKSGDGFSIICSLRRSGAHRNPGGIPSAPSAVNRVCPDIASAVADDSGSLARDAQVAFAFFQQVFGRQQVNKFAQVDAIAKLSCRLSANEFKSKAVGSDSDSDVELDHVPVSVWHAFRLQRTVFVKLPQKMLKFKDKQTFRCLIVALIDMAEQVFGGDELVLCLDKQPTSPDYVSLTKSFLYVGFEVVTAPSLASLPLASNLLLLGYHL